MGELFTTAWGLAKIGSAVAFLCLSFARADAVAGPPEGNGAPTLTATDVETRPSPEWPILPAPRPPALQLLWFDPAEALPGPATDALAEEVRTIFRGLGVEVAFRVAAPGATYGDGPIPEVPIILLRDDPIVERRPSRVLGLVVRHQAPSRAVWAFLDNVRWTLGEDPHERPVAGRARDLGTALGRVVAHEVIHAIAPGEPHSKDGLMSHSMNRGFLLGKDAPLEARCGRAFMIELAARRESVPGDGPAASLALVR
jgi:hypothetical protein